MRSSTITLAIGALAATFPDVALAYCSPNVEVQIGKLPDIVFRGLFTQVPATLVTACTIPGC